MGFDAFGIMGEPGADKTWPPGFPIPWEVLDLIIGAGDEYDGDAVKAENNKNDDGSNTIRQKWLQYDIN